jgi:kinesin family protein C2/C3
MAKGEKRRSTTGTDMNEHSSRSHSMLSVYITTEHKVTGQCARGKLHLVDLAGSERISKTGATGQQLKEAQNINKSLSALGDVVASRVAKQSHTPYRNSTLTYLLQDSLEKDSKTLMVCCISPASFNAEESICTLNFASRVRNVELGKAKRNTAKKKR